MNYNQTLEFDIILNRLAELACTQTAKSKSLSLKPYLSEREAKRNLNETSQAKDIIEKVGTPPLADITDINKIIALVEAGDMLVPEQFEKILLFAVTCKRLKQYLKRAESTGSEIAFYGGVIIELLEIESEIERCIRNGRVDDRATSSLYDIRRQIENAALQIKTKLNAILAKNKNWFSDSFVSTRGEYYTLPVKREFKNNVPGTVVEISNTGGTCFIEPAAVSKLREQLTLLEIEEDAEIRKILYTLTGLIDNTLPDIYKDIQAVETLDFLFAKAKLSIEMHASDVILTTERIIDIKNAIHPLLDENNAVPLDFELLGDTRGIVITGPNTGGKTVALKTVGLLSLMAQSGLHVPASKDSIFTMNNLVLCDIGDNQSISENLSTFSAHIKNIVEILSRATCESLVLLDELGSGTDPQEGMGLAVAILEELCNKGCLFVVTTHYPEVKEYAKNREGIKNARMAFDRQNLKPLYKLELGEAGQSCALYIAKRLGMPEHILFNANSAAYAQTDIKQEKMPVAFELKKAETKKAPKAIIKDVPKKEVSQEAQRFNIGDSVIVYPQKEIGIVYAKANEIGEVGVQIKKEKKLIPHKRIKLNVAAQELYPEDYDFSIIFDTVENRKARHLMDKRHVENNISIINEGDKEKQ